MVKKIDILLLKYEESHKNVTNKIIHWLCVPAIMFSLVGLLYSLPFIVTKSWYFNWASLLLLLVLVYYYRLSVPMFIGFVLLALLLLFGNFELAQSVGDGQNMMQTSLSIFAVAWILQFVGHKIEGKKPSFLQDLQFLLIGPAWLMHFIFNQFGIKY